MTTTQKTRESRGMTTYLIVGALGLGALSAAAYFTYYAAFKNHGNSAALSPLEAYLAARFNRSKLDRELAKILGPTESR